MDDNKKSHEEEVKKAELVLKKKEMDLYEQLIQSQVKKPLFKSPTFWVGFAAVIIILGMTYAGQLYRQEMIQNNLKEVALVRQASQDQVFQTSKRYKSEIDSLRQQIDMMQKQNQDSINMLKSSNSTSINALQSSLKNALEQNKQLNKTNEYLKYIIAGLSQNFAPQQDSSK